MTGQGGYLQRRALLRLLAGGAALAAFGDPAAAAVRREPKLPRLIEESRRFPGISARIDFISGGLIGTPYRAHTLIGGPKTSEILVTREDGFDCVTFCETVLAAAIAQTPEDFAPALRRIRYHDGLVTWFARNHYHHEWSERNVANRLCRDVELPGEVIVDKTVYWHRALGRRQFKMRVIPAKSFLDNRAMLATGDIVGFVTRRPNLDYFHTGLVIFERKGAFLLRHAAESRGRVIDEPMAEFVRRYGVRYVTVLRPQETAAGTSASKL